MGTSFGKTISRWLRNKPQRVYEWQFSRQFWELKARWERIKFNLGKASFSLKSWAVSGRTSVFIFIEIIKTVFAQVITAIIIVIAIYFLSPYISHFLPSVEAQITSNFLGIVAQVGGVFLGLYFTAVSVLASSVYAKVPGDVRELLTKEKVGNEYIVFVALTVAVASLCLAKGALGYSFGALDILVVAILLAVAVFSFLRLGMRVFDFFDFTKLAKILDTELIRWIQSATIIGYRFNDPSFQAHYQKQAERALRTYDSLVTLAIGDNNCHSKVLSDLSLTPLLIFQFYITKKTLIPSDSRWFDRVYYHRKWLTTDATEVSLALGTHTSLMPEQVPDPLWFEKHIEKIVGRIFKILIERKDLDYAAAVLNNIFNIERTLGENLAVDEALHLLRSHEKQIIDIMSTEDSYTSNEDAQLKRLNVINIYCYGLISLILGLSKTLQDPQNTESFWRRINNINWKKVESIYSAPMPLDVIKRLETLHSRLDFEYQVEGVLVSSKWYCQQLVSESIVRFLERTADELIKQYESLFGDEADRLISEGNFLNATQVVLTGLEAYDKFLHYLETAKASFNQYSTFRRVQDIPWATFSSDAYLRRILAVKERLITDLAKSSTQLVKIPSKPTWPDYFGQCYSVLAEECLSSLDLGNEKLFDQVFIAFFFVALEAYDKLQTELKGRSDQAAIVYMTEPLVDLLSISGFALAYSELDNKKYWNTVKCAWDKYLGGQTDSKARVGLLVNIAIYRQSVFSILPRDTIRIAWQQKLEKRLRDEKILTEDFSSPFGGDENTPPKHLSKLIQLLGRGTLGTIDYDGQDIFIGMYLSKRPEASGVTLPHKAQNFLDSFTIFSGNNNSGETVDEA